MEFRNKVKDYLEKNGITVERIEQKGEVASIVCHIPKSDNEKVEKLKEEMEKELNVVVVASNNYGMNVIIVESNDLEE